MLINKKIIAICSISFTLPSNNLSFILPLNLQTENKVFLMKLKLKLLKTYRNYLVISGASIGKPVLKCFEN